MDFPSSTLAIAFVATQAYVAFRVWQDGDWLGWARLWTLGLFAINAVVTAGLLLGASGASEALILFADRLTNVALLALALWTLPGEPIRRVNAGLLLAASVLVLMVGIAELSGRWVTGLFDLIVELPLLAAGALAAWTLARGGSGTSRYGEAAMLIAAVIAMRIGELTAGIIVMSVIRPPSFQGWIGVVTLVRAATACVIAVGAVLLARSLFRPHPEPRRRLSGATGLSLILAGFILGTARPLATSQVLIVFTFAAIRPIVFLSARGITAGQRGWLPQDAAALRLLCLPTVSFVLGFGTASAGWVSTQAAALVVGIGCAVVVLAGLLGRGDFQMAGMVHLQSRETQGPPRWQRILLHLAAQSAWTGPGPYGRTTRGIQAATGCPAELVGREIARANARAEKLLREHRIHTTGKQDLIKFTWARATGTQSTRSRHYWLTSEGLALAEHLKSSPEILPSKREPR